jgi:dolichyl-phosphate-mannose-protein mannosyltransferase
MWCAIYLGCLLIVGFSVASRLVDDRSLLEHFAVAACLGPAIVALLLIFLSMLGFLPSATEIICITILFAPLGFLHRRKPASPRPASDISGPIVLWKIACLLAIAYGFTVVCIDAFSPETITWDAFAIWQLKAKILATHPLSPRPGYFTNVSLSFSHLVYPILLPMLCAGVHAMAGNITSGLEKSPTALLFAGMGAAVYTSIRIYRGPISAITATALLLTLPTLLTFAGAGTADVPLTALYAGSILCLLRWQDKQQTRDLISFSLFTAMLPWTKHEGLALAAINFFVLLILTPKPFDLRNIRREFLAAIFVLVIYLPWFFYTRHLPQTDENYAQLLTPTNIIAGAGRLPTILSALLGEAVTIYNWGIFWLLLPAAAAINFSRTLTRPVATLWALLFLQILSLMPPFMVVKSWNLKELLFVTQDRLLLHMAPAAAILIGYYFFLESPPEDQGGYG